MQVIWLDFPLPAVKPTNCRTVLYNISNQLLSKESPVPEPLIKPWSTDYEDYLRDESRRVGAATSISFPASESEVIRAIREARARGETITIQGARTGIVAGAVPDGGHVLNVSRMNAISEITADHHLIVGPGAILDDIRKHLAGSGLFFPPDPTETTASIGGMVAANASGAGTYHYGPTRNWITALRIVLADGDAIAIRRGQHFARGRHFTLTTEAGRVISGPLPTYTQPNVKSAAGYYVTDDMDLIDLFIGSEGTLGVLTQAELRLICRPAAIHGLTVFLPTQDAAIALVRALRGEAVDGLHPLDAHPVAIEFFNSDALDLLRKARSESSAFESIPSLKPHYHTAIYTEFHRDSDDDAESAVMQVIEAVIALGGSDEDTWYATTDREMEPLKAFRHATPEAVNLLIGERKREYPDLTKLGTDMSVPDPCLAEVITMYNTGLAQANLQSVIFGHIGANHVHVNILPRNQAEYDRGKDLYMQWAARVVSLGGSVSAEHGIGKIKAPFLRLMYGDEGIEEMRALRKLFDPDGALNVGNLF